MSKCMKKTLIRDW